AQSQAYQRTRGVARHAGGKLAQKSSAVFERAAVAALARGGAQKFVTQIAMAVLQINEAETGGFGSHGGLYEIADQVVNLGVGQTGVIWREVEFTIQDRMVIEDARF